MKFKPHFHIISWHTLNISSSCTRLSDMHIVQSHHTIEHVTVQPYRLQDCQLAYDTRSIATKLWYTHWTTRASNLLHGNHALFCSLWSNCRPQLYVMHEFLSYILATLCPLRAVHVCAAFSHGIWISIICNSMYMQLCRTLKNVHLWQSESFTAEKFHEIITNINFYQIVKSLNWSSSRHAWRGRKFQADQSHCILQSVNP